jgi:glutamine---fructose-6-phosphate transaminase (isomerizing)
MSQPQIWQDAIAAFHQQSGALRALWQQGGFDSVLFTGCGSTYYLAHTSAALFQQLTGISARAYPASEIALFSDLVFSPKHKPLLVTVSRSGETTETVEATRVYRQRGGTAMLTVTCDSSTTLARQANLVFAIDSAQETSLAQTRSFASMLIVTQTIAAFLGGQDDLVSLDQLPSVANRLLTDYHDLAKQLGEDKQIERFFFLGSGALYGIASEGMLKMKEMSLSYSESFHTLEFRHGPMSMVDDRALIIGLLSEEAAPQETAVLRQMRARGAQILALSEGTIDLDDVHSVVINSGVPGWARPMAYLPVMQLMAYYRAMINGQNPDQPANLTFVISLDESMT